jgi:two-component system sensor histidine kinase KdpD
MTATLKKQAIAIRQAERETLQNALLASLSHDFRTPLTTIVGSATSLRLQKESLSQSQQETLLRLIETEALSMVDDAENILSLTRVETLGMQALSADWQSPQELISAVTARCRQRHPQRLFITQVQEELPLIFVDAKLVIQALTNLVENALKFDDSSQAISLEATMMQPYLCLSVRDHGVGFTQDQQQLKIKFMRGKTESAHPGFGLGLSICDAVARVHQGQLLLENQKEGGVLASLQLPIKLTPF